MKALQCDKCGKYYTEEPSVIITTDIGEEFIIDRVKRRQTKFGPLSGFILGVDLCQTCLKIVLN